ncbi:MAG: hypothetical protein ACR2IF_16640 [Terriglobales bacterium]
MTQIIQIGKPSPSSTVFDMIRQMAAREAEEIQRLKQAAQAKIQH